MAGVVAWLDSALEGIGSWCALALEGIGEMARCGAFDDVAKLLVGFVIGALLGYFAGRDGERTLWLDDDEEWVGALARMNVEETVQEAETGG